MSDQDWGVEKSLWVDQDAQLASWGRLAKVMAQRGPYPREARPDEVLCLECAMIMPCTLQVDHRTALGHTEYCWAAPGLTEPSVPSPTRRRR